VRQDILEIRYHWRLGYRCTCSAVKSCEAKTVRFAISEEAGSREFREHLRAQALSAFINLGHRETGVVIENRLRHAGEKVERRHSGYLCQSGIRQGSAHPHPTLRIMPAGAKSNYRSGDSSIVWSTSTCRCPRLISEMAKERSMGSPHLNVRDHLKTCSAIFRDDREDYDAALQQHYAKGVPH
jgi:hypothetical protein